MDFSYCCNGTAQILGLERVEAEEEIHMLINSYLRRGLGVLSLIGI